MGRPKANIPSGSVYGRLTVQSELPRRIRQTEYSCSCSCGATKIATAGALMRGNVKSCGCWRRENSKAIHTTHGGAKTQLFYVWHTMRRRCSDPNTRSHKNYGQRGIKVCSDWADNFGSFRAWAEGAGYRAGLQLNRVDNDGPYSPENCEWTTCVLNNNNRNNNVRLTIFGETKTMADWSRDRNCNVSYSTLRQRLSYGWNPERALTKVARNTGR